MFARILQPNSEQQLLVIKEVSSNGPMLKLHRQGPDLGLETLCFFPDISEQSDALAAVNEAFEKITPDAVRNLFIAQATDNVMTTLATRFKELGAKGQTELPFDA